MIGSIIQGATSVASGIGGLIGARKDKKAAENAANKSWQRNYEAQKEFAQNSIQWRVQDAKRAGINPYAVISGQSAGYTPQDTSYQTGYQQAVSQGMNGLADAMGQLQMALAKEDLKGKEIDNQKKALELTNAAVKANLGQTPKTFTNPAQKVSGYNLITDADGSQYFVPDVEMSVDDLSGMKQGMGSMYSSELYKALKKANKGGHVELGALGYRYVPKASKTSSAVNRKAADIAERTGVLSGLLSLPSLWLQNGISTLERAWRRKR